ncbi:alpha amylase family protein [Paenibacillus sp. GCM10027626]|uniref:alpha amylase family protein n=1 Tax=Paenibacillus sp. GCM10027626 TaxID=3273411 RepID=UPI003626F382
MKTVIEQGSNILWVDFLANGRRLADQHEQQRLVDNAKRSHITHLVVDAKIPYGHTTYPSKVAPHVSNWSDGRFAAWEGRDYLGELLEAAHAAGLKVIANVNVFAEGTRRSNDGIAYDKKEWQVVYVRPASNDKPLGFVPAEQYPEDSLFVNPIHEEVRMHQLAVLRELAAGYELDGIALDRCRYPNIYGDFSALSRMQFEQFIGRTAERWPEDIFTENEGRMERGKLFSAWIEWRARNIKSFVQEAKSLVKSLKPEALFCIYVGSWYPVYYQEGVNWASATYRPQLEWTSSLYHEAGYADELDFLMTGCYYRDVYKQEAVDRGTAAWVSVEGGIEQSHEAVNGQIPFFASLFLHDYQADSDQFAKAVRLCRERSHGVMLFDVCYLEMYSWWGILPALLK